MKDFVLWFLAELPDFLLTPPVSLIMGFFMLALVIDMIIRIRNI